jgi:hypothetical protein
MSGVDLALVPVVLVPASALLILIFYNRLIALTIVLHRLQKDLRGMVAKLHAEKNKETQICDGLRKEHDALAKELDFSHHRHRVMQSAILLNLMGFVWFFISGILSVLFDVHNAFHMFSSYVWLLGAVFLLIGIMLGMYELRLSGRSSMLETHLLHDL